MYVDELFIKNSGPLAELPLNFQFGPEGLPLPTLIVGPNGSGKTTLLSVIGDALIHAASTPFDDVVTPYAGSGKSYFRLVGGRLVSHGAAGAFSVLKLIDGADAWYYAENSGNFAPGDAKAMLSESLSPGVTWKQGSPTKKNTIPAQRAKTIFRDGVYAYFPSTRSEQPHWLNRESLLEDSFDIQERVESNLRKPLFIEHAIERFSQWLMGVLTDSRMPVAVAPTGNDPSEYQLTLKRDEFSMSSMNILMLANLVLRTICDDPEATFYWSSRHDQKKIGIFSGTKVVARGLDSLSAGQSSLLAIFGTILQYADMANTGALLSPGNTVRGVVVVDEIDTHMHIKLQLETLPALVSMFPGIQFIVSSHSPFFALGMERRYTGDGFRIIKLPSGISLNAESYEEFGDALDALRDTEAFADAVRDRVSSGETPLVWVAGQTDVKYFKTAARLLGYAYLVDYFELIGESGAQGGPKYTGDSSLDKALEFIKRNPKFSARTVVIVYDCDAPRSDVNLADVHILNLPQIQNAICEKGIENLLPKDVFNDDDWGYEEKITGTGKPTIVQPLRKVELCERLCGDDALAENFENFRPTLDRINELVGGDTVSRGVTSSTGNDRK